MKQKVQHATLWAVTASGVLLVAVLLFFKLGPTVEKWASPLFSNVAANFVDIKPDHTDILIRGVKARSCLLVLSNTEVYIEGRTISAKTILLNQDGTELAIEQQRVSVGNPFVRLARITPAGSHVKITVFSRCHPFWLSSQDLVELDVQKYPAQVR